MKFLVIGLGSMGKRRIRNLHSLGEQDIIGVDPREDRRAETLEKYGIDSVAEATSHLFSQRDVVFICVDPALHMKYAAMAAEDQCHCFIEASVVNEGIKTLANRIKNTELKFYASCTLRFHPAIRQIKVLLGEGKLGVVSNFSYHTGQYLPDWHPWESITDFYVSRRETGGCREIVPFELSWMNWVFGPLREITGFHGKTIDLGADIDDVYTAALRYENGVMGTLVVDVVSRDATRLLMINCENGQVFWNWSERNVRVLQPDGQWTLLELPEGKAADGYNANIIEEMYIDEVRAFLDSITNDTPVLNTLEDDLYTLSCLYAIEHSDKTKMVVRV